MNDNKNGSNNSANNKHNKKQLWETAAGELWDPGSVGFWGSQLKRTASTIHLVARPVCHLLHGLGLPTTWGWLGRCVTSKLQGTGSL
eukprot:3812973-Amphidinium_carterae.1